MTELTQQQLFDAVREANKKMNINMNKINAYTRRTLTEDDVFCFDIMLCDNEVDRDNEKFSGEALDKLAELFVGRPGIFDHDYKSSGQTARIYDTEVIAFPDRETADGQEYAALMGYAYMVRTDENRSLIAEIEGGIKKEVSVGCSVKKRVCSICGTDNMKHRCSHEKGKIYENKLCFMTLEEPIEAYEWSFVAVPIQRTPKYQTKPIVTLREKELEVENTELKELLKSAYDGYMSIKSCKYAPCTECENFDGDLFCDGKWRWKYADEVERILGEDS